MARVLALTAAAALLSAALALAQSPPPAAGFAPLAHSAQLTAEAARTGGTLLLRLRRAGSGTLLTGALLTAAIDGHDLPVTALADGTFRVALQDLPARSPGRLDLVVAHDGVRELLSGTLPASPNAAPAAGGVPAGASSQRKQLAWWLLNIGIVLVAAIAISRRMS